jgi:hypothetical protein
MRGECYGVELLPDMPGFSTIAPLLRCDWL